jgi:hypothetical protein
MLPPRISGAPGKTSRVRPENRFFERTCSNHFGVCDLERGHPTARFGLAAASGSEWVIVSAAAAARRL